VFNLVRAYTPFTVLLFFIAGFVLHADALVAPQARQIGVSGPIYDLFISGVNGVLQGNAFGYTLVGLLMLMASLLYLNMVLVRNRVFVRPGYVPAFAGLLLSALLPPLRGLPVWILIMGFAVLALGALLSVNTAQGGRRALFNSGFWAGLAALFAFPSMPLVVGLAVGLAVLRPFKSGEWMVLLLGFFTPAYFCAALLFLVDLLPLAKEWPSLHFARPAAADFKRADWTAIVGTAILIIVGATGAMRLTARSAISVRRSWLVLGVGCTVATLTAILCTEGHDAQAFLVVLPWLTPVIATPAALEKKTRFGTFIFYSLIALVIAVRLL
jgi:hypothetical protein